MFEALPGRPQSHLQGLATECWDSKHITTYVSGSAIAILDESCALLQTVYDESEEPLTAIALDEYTGKIAVSTTEYVRIYKPQGRRENALKWTLERTLDIPDHDEETPCVLSWGSSEELLIASKSLNLISVQRDTTLLWQKRLPSQTKSAALSYDSAYIFTFSHFDRSPKVWRRLTYGQDDIRFDLTYLPHRCAVTAASWRKPFHVDQTTENVLYTFCLDNIVRIWVPIDSLGGHQWHLWNQIDLLAPAENGVIPRDVRLVFMIDSRDFTASVERAVEHRMTNDMTTDDVALDHLVAVANRSPEICVTIDSNGFMCASALENVRSSTAASSQVFNIVQIKSDQMRNLDDFLPAGCKNAPYIVAKNYCHRGNGKLHLLLHAFDGRIGVFSTSVADLFDLTTNADRLRMQTTWSGNSAPIRKIVRNFSGNAIASRVESGESVVWKHEKSRKDTSTWSLVRQSVINEKSDVLRTCLLRKGRFVALLYTEAISLWDCRSEDAALLVKQPFKAPGSPLCLILLPRPELETYTTAHITTITSEGHSVVWEITLPAYSDGNNGTGHATIREFCRSEIDGAHGLAYVLPIDPAGFTPVASGFLDVFARDVAISYTSFGRVEFWTARVDVRQRKVDWLSTCCTETSIDHPARVNGSMLKKAALVDSTRSQLTIWDIGNSRLEFDTKYGSGSTIQDLDWTSTPDSQSILAVGFQYCVVILAQMRFDYLNAGPAWSSIREISIRELTPHPIGDSTWLRDGHLVIGAGHQLFVYNRKTTIADISVVDRSLTPRKDKHWDLFEAVQRFNGTLPVFHPQFLSQCILAGKTDLVKKILLKLDKTLKFHIEEESVDNYLGIASREFYSMVQPIPGRSQRTQSSYLNSSSVIDDAEEDVFTEQTADFIKDKLTKLSIPQLAGYEQMQLVDIVECVGLVEKQRRSMDENGARFMLIFRQSALQHGRSHNVHVSWREINWAYHSISQDILADFVSRQYQGGMLWRHARESGIFMWLSDSTAVRSRFEVIARNEYTKSEDKNPVDCSLYYLALKKKAVLQGLWRMANGNKEQVAIRRLLANDFDDPKHKKTALKNAYALLSKRRFEYAAAFFLLAGNVNDAVEVCLRQLKDIQLAIAICRVHEGDHGPVLKRVLQDEILPLAAREGNRWLASWVFWMLGRRDMAVRALITPVYALVETPCALDYKSRSFLTDDPALVVLYSQLREKTLQTLRGASRVTPRAEWEFVLHNAKIYDRMGCDLLGLDLVRNWEFQRPAAKGLGGELNPLKLLRRRSSLVIDDLPTLSLSRGVREGASKATKTPTMFEEPDSSSLLDNFGF